MRRRTFLLAGVMSTRARADTRQELTDLFTSMAEALSEADPARFLRAIDPSMADYARFAANVTALATQNDLSSSIEIRNEVTDDAVQTIELDWLLEIRGKDQSHVFLRRQSIVKCKLERPKKQWRIFALDPPGFFAPPGK